MASAKKKAEAGPGLSKAATRPAPTEEPAAASSPMQQGDPSKARELVGQEPAAPEPLAAPAPLPAPPSEPAAQEPPPAAPATKRYRVWKHGELHRNRVVYMPGEELDLHDDVAAQLGAVVEPVQ